MVLYIIIFIIIEMKENFIIWNLTKKKVILKNEGQNDFRIILLKMIMLKLNCMNLIVLYHYIII